MGDWSRVPVSELCEMVVDCVNKTAPTVEIPTPYKMIRTTNIKKGRIDLSDCRSVTKETFVKWTKRAEVVRGDVLLTREAPMGEAGKVNFDCKVFLGQRVVQYRVNSEKLTSDFLLYSFLSPDLQYQFRKHNGGGSTVSHIRVPDCLKFEIPLPSLAEQQNIAAVLSALDAKIDLNNRINAELEALAKTIYDYWFVQFDFPDANGRPYKSSGGAMVWNDTLKREIPVGWNDGILSDIANITMGQSPSGDSYNEEEHGVVFFQGSTDFGVRSPEVRMYTTSPARMAAEGDILVSVRAPVGTLNIADRTCCIGRGLSALKSKPNFEGYLYQVMVGFKQTFNRRSSEGTTFGSINKDDLLGLPVLLPQSGALLAYAAMAKSWGALADVRTKENRELTQLRDWLLPLLMNGQVRVTGDAA